MADNTSYGLVNGGNSATSLPNGTLTNLRAGQQGEQIVASLHGSCYTQAYSGRLFRASNQAAVSTTAGLATTWTGFAISNPAGSGVNLVPRKFMVAQVAAGVAGAVGLMSGTGAAAGSLIVRTAKVGGAVSLTIASAGATIATPILEGVYGQIGSVATTAYGLTPGLVVDLDGDIIIPPGFFLASYTTAATTTALAFGMVWEEVAL